jgi:Tfp pilus assembly protein PilN
MLKVRGFVALAVTFLILLTNFVVYSSLNSSNQRLAEQVSLTAQSSEDIHKIDSEVTKKQALLKILGWEANINKSSLIDQVASLLPPELTWKEISIDPIDPAASRRQKTVIFSTGKISVTGTSERIIPVDEWIARIKTRPWVKNASLDSYRFNSELNTGQFTVIIDY